jgi:hypothetical protein
MTREEKHRWQFETVTLATLLWPWSWFEGELEL